LGGRNGSTLALIGKTVVDFVAIVCAFATEDKGMIRSSS
jgi:hypothetical protein